MVIVKADLKSVPDIDKIVAPVNLSSLSMFSSLSTKINDQEVSSSTSHYNYKSYLQFLMSYGDAAKTSHFLPAGYADDTTVVIDGVECNEPHSTNSGFMIRNSWFREGMNTTDATKPYSKDGYVFLGPFLHELSGISQCLPPMTKVGFSLKKENAGWFLMKPQDKTDTEKYEFKILSCSLFVKQVTLTTPLYNELTTRRVKENYLKYHFRKMEMKWEVISGSSMFYETNNIFPDSSSPLRLFFMIVKQASLSEDYSLNPFHFLRCVPIKSKPTVSGVSDKPDVNLHILNQTTNLNQQIKSFQEKIMSALHKNRRPRSHKKHSGKTFRNKMKMISRKEQKLLKSRLIY